MLPIIRRLKALYLLQSVDRAEKTASGPCVTVLNSLSNCPASPLPLPVNRRFLRAPFLSFPDLIRFSHKECDGS